MCVTELKLCSMSAPKFSETLLRSNAGLIYSDTNNIIFIVYFWRKWLMFLVFNAIKCKKKTLKEKQNIKNRKFVQILKTRPDENFWIEKEEISREARLYVSST